jgi:mRNA interferase MazF
MDYTPDKGHVVWITFNPQAGHEEMGRRPALVLSPISYNSKTDLAILCPITSEIKGYPFEVLIPDVFPLKGVILADQVKNLDWKSRKSEYCFSISNEVLTEVQQKLKALIF